MVIVSAVGVSKSEPQGRSGLVRKNSGAYGEKAVKGGRGQHMTAMARRGWTDGSDRLRRGRQRNGLRDHLLDFRLVRSQRLHGYGICVVLLDIPQKQALVMRQLVLKVPIGCVAPISGSCGPKRVGELAPWLRTQGAAVTVYRPVLAFQAQRLSVRNIRSCLTSPLRNQHDPSFLGYLVLEISQRPRHARCTIFIRLDTVSFPPANT